MEKTGKGEEQGFYIEKILKMERFVQIRKKMSIIL